MEAELEETLVVLPLRVPSSKSRKTGSVAWLKDKGEGSGALSATMFRRPNPVVPFKTVSLCMQQTCH